MDMALDLSALPDTAANAVKLMLAGAALALVQGIVAAISEVHRPVAAILAIVFAMVVAGVWWLIARSCQRGSDGGRVLGSMAFGLSTLGIVQTLTGNLHVKPASTVIDVLSWLVGLGAIVMLWHRESSAFFQKAG